MNANDISDGYHTFGQLYDCRLAYNAAFNEWGNLNTVGITKDPKEMDGVKM
jgi:hypothetical protein